MKFITKLLILVCDYRYVPVGLLLILSISWFNTLDLFEYKSEYYLNQSSKRAWGYLDSKEYKGKSDQYAYRFSFVLPEEGEFKGVSYNYFDKFSLGDSVMIEYHQANPLYARITKMKVLEGSKAVLYFRLILIALGVLLLLWVIFRRLSIIRSAKPAALKPINYVSMRPVQWFISYEDGDDRYSFLFYVFSFKVKGSKKGYDLWASRFSVDLTNDDQYGILKKNGELYPLNLMPGFLRNSVLDQLKKDH